MLSTRATLLAAMDCAWYCPTCGDSGQAKRKDGTPRSARVPQRDVLPEHYVQREFERVARSAGFVVQHASEHRNRCPRCGITPGGSNGQSAGLGDSHVTHPDWGGLWLKIELKGTYTPWTTPAQQQMHEAGLVRRYRHPSVALAALLELHDRLTCLLVRAFARSVAARRSSLALQAYLRERPAPGVDAEGRPLLPRK